MHLGKNDLLRLLNILVSLVIVSQTNSASAQTAFVPNDKPQLMINRASGPIKIDGDFDDAGWRDAAKATNFSETSPGDRTKPPVETEVLVTYDNDNFYLGFICSDDSAAVRATMRDRDEIFSDDYVGILLDTYGDASWAYEIFVNPLGCQGDVKLTTDGQEDGQFDIVFYSKGKVTDTGYQVEVAIPFASLRFPNKSIQEWKANFWRNRPRSSRERYSWAAINRDVPCNLCQWGTLRGMADAKPAGKYEILPSLISYQTTQLRDPYDLGSGLKK